MPYSGITQTYTPNQGQKSIRFKHELREFLSHEGLSEQGIQQLLDNQPISSQADRHSIHAVLIRLFREHSERLESQTGGLSSRPPPDHGE